MAVTTLNVVDQQAVRDAQRMRAQREELVERIARAVGSDGTIHSLPGLYLTRRSVPLEQIHAVVEPCLCIVAQGSKEFLVGGSTYRYDPFHYLLVTVDLPNVGQVIEASRELPYLGVRLDLPPTLVSAVMMEVGYPSQTSPLSPASPRAISASPVDADLLDAAVRLVRLLDSPGDARILLPLITREIVYRLLTGEQAGRLRYLARLTGYSPIIATAIERLRVSFDQPLRVEQLARELGMSVSSLHHHFKAVTALSPLQYQKRLRLLEARRLMVSEDCDAATAAFRVGYRDVSHFNREYKGLFGAPPLRDIRQLRDSTPGAPQ